MSEILLSICIPTCNREKIVSETVHEILTSCQSSKIEIVVSDNNSTDGTYNALKKIEDARLHVFKMEENKGFLKNVINAFDHAKGKYICLLLDKDYIKTTCWNKIFSDLEEQELVGGYFSLGSKKRPYTNQIHLFSSKIDKIEKMMFLFRHPSGYFFNRKFYHTLSKDFYHNVNIVLPFPGDFIITELEFKYDNPVAILDYPCVFKSPLADKRNKTPSLTYSQKNKNLYFTPTEIQKTVEECLYRIKEFSFSGKEHFKAIKKIFVDNFKRMTLEYADYMKDSLIAEHYFFEQKVVSVKEVKSLRKEFLKFIKNSNAYNNWMEKELIYTYLNIKTFFIMIHYSNKIRKKNNL